MKDNRETIESFLDTYAGPQKRVGDDRVVLCPFHGDQKTPNLNIFVVPGMSIPLGYFHCFACGEKGSWNKFAEFVGGPKIKEWKNLDIPKVQIGRDLLDTDTYTLSEIMKTMGNPAYIKWPTSLNWRGFSGNLINSLGGYMIPHNEEVILFLPVSVNKKIVGGVRAYREKKEKRPSYLTTRGSWVSNEGLLFFDQSKKMKKNYITLVEGPRDALRLIKNGIPSCAILGANSFSERKAKKILSLNPEKVWVIPDNDKGGLKMAENVHRELEEKIETQTIHLPRKIKGEPVKMDPGDAPKKLIRQIFNIVEN